MQESRALIVLTPAESKRLIARAVASLPEVKRALKKGRVVLAGGSTNAFVAGEILGTKVPAEQYMAGYITGGELKGKSNGPRINPYVLIDGKVEDISPGTALADFGPDDVFIKGANAVDPSGKAGVFLGDPSSGTIGKALPVVIARGSHLIIPVGLEKLVPDVLAAAAECGQGRFKQTTGIPVGLMPLVTGKVVTETVALETMFGVKAMLVAAGGIGGSEGSVCIVITGEEGAVDDAMRVVRGLKGEPAVKAPGE
ncbi:MAG: hypothetical protein ACM3X4_12935 [Ignavibacteriales bacterium]